jgi:hypothetical protein
MHEGRPGNGSPFSLSSSRAGFITSKMRIGRPLLKLPIRFCGETLAREISALPPEAWMQHPQKFDGNCAVPLVSPDGALVNQAYGPMAPTRWLQDCTYVGEIMQALGSTWGRSRLMGLEAGAVVPAHVDTHYYWRTHLRIHIPAITNPGVTFTCDGEATHMAAGECWILDSFYMHSVANRGSDLRVHLVLDTVGSGRLWDLIAAAKAGAVDVPLVNPSEAIAGPLDFEQVNAPVVMSPWEMKAHLAYLADWTDPQPGLDETLGAIDRFVMVWSGTWARHTESDAGLPIYLSHLDDVRGAIAELRVPKITMRNGQPLLASIEQFIFKHAIAPAIVQKIQKASGEGLQRRLTA